MRYFHRTTLEAEAVMEAADQFFSSHMQETSRDTRRRSYSASIGSVELVVRAEGGHYTNISASTDQVGESEADKLVKRFLGSVHTKLEPRHHLRGAY